MDNTFHWFNLGEPCSNGLNGWAEGVRLDHVSRYSFAHTWPNVWEYQLCLGGGQRVCLRLDTDEHQSFLGMMDALKSPDGPAQEDCDPKTSSPRLR